ncbi:lactosylceramide 1,3-N-acetyl-beta-D-glucosaminyltransferase-like [Amphiura filiformis]|uniref:lactosylceramide 1,3-N-acetyl-beta-D-glucosaminyltransferase-like n=1 Tax=Amphiura filiformis TaxID=82378 RepID=UPI003B224AD6
MIIRDTASRYYVSERDLKRKEYPPYASGGSYVLTTDIVADLYKQALNTSLISVDDGYQGVVGEILGMTWLANRGFKLSGWGKEKTCSLCSGEALTMHGYENADHVFEMWAIYINATASCRDHGSLSERKNP